MKPRQQAAPASGLTVFQLDGAGGAREASPAGFEATGEKNRPVWIHVDFANPRGVDWIMKSAGLDETVARAMVEDESRPRTLRNEEGLLTILRGVNLNPESEVEDMISIRVWVDRQRVISASRRRLKSVEEIRAALENRRGPVSATGFLVDLINQLEDRISAALDSIEQSLEQAESSIGNPAMIQRSGPFSALRRQTARIRRYLAPQREALDRLSRFSDFLFTPDEISELTEQVNRLTIIVEDLDLIRERAMVAQEEFLGILAHEQNSKMFLLSIVAAVFLPLSFLTGLMGMNVAGLPGTENQWAFMILVVLMIVTAVVILALFKKKKWF